MTAQKKGERRRDTGRRCWRFRQQSAKPWIKKSPVEIILEQVAKQEEKVEAMRKELAKEEGELKKMQDATKLLQAK